MLTWIALSTVLASQHPPESGQAERAPIVWQTLNEPGVGGWVTSLSVSPFDSKRVLVGGDMLGIGLSTDGGDSWQSTFGVPSWEIADFTWHPTEPQTVWAGSMSGPLVSRDGGKNWRSMRQGMPPFQGWAYSVPIQCIQFDPANRQRLLAFGGSYRRWQAPTGAPRWGAVWESTDSGTTWRALTTLTPTGSNPVPESQGVNITSVSWSTLAVRLYATLDRAGVVVSTDAGVTWRPSNQGLPHLNVHRVVSDPRQPLRAYVSLDNAPVTGGRGQAGIYGTVNGGITWTRTSTGLMAEVGPDENQSSRYQSLALAPSRPQRLVTADTSWKQGVVYTSDNNATSWTRRITRPEMSMATPAGLGMTVAAFDPRDANTIFMAGSEAIIRSKDGGKTWTDASSRPVGTAWRGRGYAGWCSMSFRFDPYRPGRAILQAMDAGRVWLTTDHGQTWRYPDTGGVWMGGRDSAFAKDGTMVSAWGQFNFEGIGRSTDDGKTWEVQAGAARGLPERGANVAQPEGVSVNPDNANLVWATIGGKLYATTNGGQQWRVVFEGPQAHRVGLDPRNPSVVYVAFANGVARSTDGVSFTSIGGPKGARYLEIDRLGRVYVTNYEGEGAGLWRWNAGQWTRLLDERQATGLAVDPNNPDRLLLMTNSDPYHDETRATGVWASSDGGKTWRAINAGLAMTRGHVVAFDPHDSSRIICGTLGRGYFIAKWPTKLNLRGTRPGGG